jgi:hypothetical protein
MESCNESTKVPTAEPFSAIRLQIFGPHLNPLYIRAYKVKDFLKWVDIGISSCTAVVVTDRLKLGHFAVVMSLYDGFVQTVKYSFMGSPFLIFSPTVYLFKTNRLAFRTIAKLTQNI